MGARTLTQAIGKQAKSRTSDAGLWMYMPPKGPRLPKKPSSKSPLAKAIPYALNRMPKTRSSLDNGFLERDNNTAERTMKPVAIGAKRDGRGLAGGENSMAIASALIETVKLTRPIHKHGSHGFWNVSLSIKSTG